MGLYTGGVYMGQNLCFANMGLYKGGYTMGGYLPVFTVLKRKRISICTQFLKIGNKSWCLFGGFGFQATAI